MRQRAIELSSGTYYSTAQGSRTGYYPYSRRVNAPPAAPYILNVQTGVLRSSWNVSIARGVDTMTVTIYNKAPYARFMTGLGTRKMIGRPILEQLGKEWGETTGRYHRTLLKALTLEEGIE
jgi:hypothetical protein